MAVDLAPEVAPDLLVVDDQVGEVVVDQDEQQHLFHP